MVLAQMIGWFGPFYFPGLVTDDSDPMKPLVLVLVLSDSELGIGPGLVTDGSSPIKLLVLVLVPIGAYLRLGLGLVIHGSCLRWARLLK
jgi:hypothetical protein